MHEIYVMLVVGLVLDARARAKDILQVYNQSDDKNRNRDTPINI